MAENDNLPERDPDAMRRRVRDFSSLTIGAIAIMSLLFLTNAVGLVEWITGSLVMLAGSLAYYVGTMPPPVDPLPKPDIDDAQLPSPDETVTSFISSMPFPALLIGPDGRVQAANMHARDVFPIGPADDVIARAAIRQPDLLDAIARVAQTVAGELVEFVMRDDAETWMAHLQPGPVSGSVLIVLEDMTAVRRAELARADFLANASHELRTPLTAVGGFIETMRGPAKDDKASWDGFLEIMQQQTERMQRLVADLLSLSRIEFSEHRTPSTRISANGVVERASLSLQPLAAEQNVTLLLDTPDERFELIADADELIQVIQNLAGNAIKYTSQGGTVKLSLGASTSMADAAIAAGRQISGASRALLQPPRASAQVPAIWIRVEDDGAGIPSEHLPRLGERFYRADKSRGGEIEGTGLGLAIVKHIMARHRGGLAVESLENEATAFGVWMPQAPAAL